MKRMCWSVAILFASVFAGHSQSPLVKVHVHVILVDSELNQKPVPFLNVTLKGAANSSDVKTRLDGTAEATLPPGAYTVTTAKPVDFDSKRYSWSLRVTLTGTEKTIDLTNENAKAEDNTAAAPPRSSGASSGDLTEQFKKLKNTVVTVISESGHGTGFFVDGKGLILTNQHVVAQSQYLAVQFDREYKIAARLIASDAQKDVALLWANMSALPSATPAVLARSSGGYAPVQEGERVFTIGSPLSLDKIITTGIVSKVDAHTIMSDININPGNSGGPLFNNAGHVVGLTTFGTSAERGPGVSGVVRIEEARALLEENRGKATGTPPPAALLPVEPLTPYPVEGLKAALQGEKFDARPYYLNAGDFEVAGLGVRNRRPPGRFWHLCCAQGQRRVWLRVFPQPAQRLRRSQPKVQDRFPEHEALLRREGSPADSSGKNSPHGQRPQCVREAGGLHLQGSLLLSAGRRKSPMRYGQDCYLFIEERRACHQNS